MTDKQILDEVYQRLCFIDDNVDLPHKTLRESQTNRLVRDMKDLIEREWQREDNNFQQQDVGIDY